MSTFSKRLAIIALSLIGLPLLGAVMVAVIAICIPLFILCGLGVALFASNAQIDDMVELSTQVDDDLVID